MHSTLEKESAAWQTSVFDQAIILVVVVVPLPYTIGVSMLLL